MNINNAMRNNNRNIWSRRLAVQAIYSWTINNCEFNNLYTIFKDDENFNKSDNDYFKDIVSGVIDNITSIDNHISDLSETDISMINYVELSIIRCFIYELGFSKKFPNEVLLAESVKLANKFGGQDSYKFINAFLEKYIKTIPNENK